MSIAERRAEERERRRNDILDAALVQFEAKGIDQATYGDIAEQARLSRSLLYTYFQDSNALMLAVAERAEHALIAAFENAYNEDETGMENLMSIFRTYCAFLNDNPIYVQAMNRAKQQLPAECNPRATGEETTDIVKNRAMEIAGNALAEGVEDGSIRADIPNELALGLALRGTAMGVASLTEQITPWLDQNKMSADGVTESAEWLIRAALTPTA